MSESKPHQRIHALPTYLANQIAAGEVVERPASVIKEVVENSIDAGASKITVTLEKGGLALIRVQDNGCGIHPEDLTLALSRHATSKISSQADLAQIYSLGFRGEALASIASVSQLTLTSRAQGHDCAYQVSVDEQAHCQTPKPAAHPEGTTVDIRTLFYNTPARRKFMRSERTEMQHCIESVKRLALSHFDVAFTLIIDGSTRYRLPAITAVEARRKRVAVLAGKAFVDQCSEIEVHAPGLRLWGWLGDANVTRSQADVQHFFLNGRALRDKLINHAVRQAYAEVVYPGRHPMYVLYLECSPREVDVNVHPTKHEVRFFNARLTHDFITHKLTPIVLQKPGASAVAPSDQTATHSNHKACAGYHQPHFENSFPDAAPSTDAVVETHKVALVPAYTLAQRYAFVHLPDAVLVLDCSALLYHYLHTSLSRALPLPRQALLIPERHRLSASVLSALLSKQALLGEWGIVCSAIDDTTLIIREWPANVPCAGVAACCQRLAAANDAAAVAKALSQVAFAIDFNTYRTDAWLRLWQDLQWQPGEPVPAAYKESIQSLDAATLSAWFKKTPANINEVS